MNKEIEAIYSSTGNLGTSRRSYDRLYSNSRKYSSNPISVETEITRITEIAERCPHKITRSVFRGLVSDNVMHHITNNSLHSYLEVALPVREFTGDDSWLIYIAKNKPDRKIIVPHEKMIKETNVQKRETATFLNRIHSITQKGYTFINQISEKQVDQLHALWGPTFGWEPHEVDNLRKRLITQNNKPASQKDVWFSAIKNQDTIISVAMAERLSIPSLNGNLNLIESTEWRTKDEYARNGFSTATIIALNAQILSDLKGDPNGIPLIYTECNFQSRSDRAGSGAGFRIPERIVAPQILVQNVLVHDDQQVGKDKLRDFTFMYLPSTIINNHYNPLQIYSIKQAANV